MKLQMDKIAHFGVGGLLTALVTIVMILQEAVAPTSSILLAPIAGHICTFILSIMKEYIIDSIVDWNDIWAAMLGSLLIHISVVIGIVFRILSL